MYQTFPPGSHAVKLPNRSDEIRCGWLLADLFKCSSVLLNACSADRHRFSVGTAVKHASISVRQRLGACKHVCTCGARMCVHAEAKAEVLLQELHDHWTQCDRRKHHDVHNTRTGALKPHFKFAMVVIISSPTSRRVSSRHWPRASRGIFSWDTDMMDSQERPNKQ